MYLQITTKCNMHCAHCCYSCGRHGKHMAYQDVLDAINIARDYDDTISIGGGEPTLHPRFFDILRQCVYTFDYIWMATNGSKTKSMYRLASIIEGFDEYASDDGYSSDAICLTRDDQLSVALSQDYFHDQIDDRIVNLWKSHKWEIRDVTWSMKGVIRAGRAAKTGSWVTEDDCVCSDIMIRANGNIHVCGCKSSPKIGTVRGGIDSEVMELLQNSEKYRDCECAKGLKRSEVKKIQSIVGR